MIPALRPSPGLSRVGSCIKFQPSCDVVEICCGSGERGAAVAPQCRTWTGCEPSQNLLALARERLAGFANVRLHYIADANLMPVGPASQDLVYATEVFLHLSRQERYDYISAARAVLRPGGQLYIDNLFLGSDLGWTQLFEPLRALPHSERPPQAGSLSTPDEFETYFSRAGFSSWTVTVDESWVVGVATK